MAALSRRSCCRGPWSLPPACGSAPAVGCGPVPLASPGHRIQCPCHQMWNLPRDSDARVDPKSFILRVPGKEPLWLPVLSAFVGHRNGAAWQRKTALVTPMPHHLGLVTKRIEASLHTKDYSMCLYTTPTQGEVTEMRIKVFTFRRVLLI